jgi:hypothetical protein
VLREEGNELDPGADTELEEDLAQVVVDGIGGHEQTPSALNLAPWLHLRHDVIAAASA